MKLPGINYTTAVGPDVSSLPLQEARAWSNAANNWAKAIDNVGRQFDATAAQEALMNAQAEASEIERRAGRPVWDVNELGEPPAGMNISTRNKTGPQQIYRMHEFAGQYYDQEIKKVGDKYGQTLSPRAKSLFNQKFMGHVTQQRNRVLEGQYNQKRDYQKGVTLKALEMATSNVDWNDRYNKIETSNELINELYRNGYIDLEDVVTEQKKYRELVIENAARRAITEAGDDITHLRDVELLISSEPMLSDKAKDRFATLAERKLARVERKEMEQDKRQRENVDMQLRLKYLEGGATTQELLETSRYEGTPNGTVQLANDIYVRGNTSTTYSDPDVRADFEDMIATARISSNFDEALSVIDNALTQVGLQPNPTLSPDDIRRFQDDVQDLRLGGDIFKSEDFKTTDDNMYVDIVGQSKLVSRRPEKEQYLKRYRDAEDDLREFLLNNRSAVPSQWWKENKQFYSLENWWDRKIGLSGVPREYVPTQSNGQPGLTEAKSLLNKDLTSGVLSEEEHTDYMLRLKQLERESK